MTVLMRRQAGPSRLTLGLLALAVISSVTMLARDIESIPPITPHQGSNLETQQPLDCSSSYNWTQHPLRHSIPETEMARLPRGKPLTFPRVQYDFSSSSNLGTDLKRDIDDSHAETRDRQQAVKNVFVKTWAAYREHAWGCDELRPVSQSCANYLNGWGAFVVGSLDTLWMMGMKVEFQESVDFVSQIDWDDSNQSRFNPFKVNAQYLGALLSAYDLSHDHVLLRKAVELGDMLYAAFDTPDHLPPFVVSFENLREGNMASERSHSSAALGAMSLEFTRLAQLTGNNKYYDAITRIKRTFAKTQGSTLLPGLWPEHINVHGGGFDSASNTFHMGGDNNALYDYLPKMYALLGGLDPEYEHMYRRAATAARNNLLFRPMLPALGGEEEPRDVLFLGGAVVGEGRGTPSLAPEMDHASCSMAGTFALAGRLLSKPDDVAIGERLARGCAWAHASTPSGLMPEKARLLACPALEGACPWDEARWLAEQQHLLECPSHNALPRGYARIDDPRALLRPEAVEGFFVLYRITGRTEYRDAAWDAFSSITRNAATPSEDVFAAVADVLAGGQLDEMRHSFSQTLKYLYLIFSDPEFMGLDDWVFSAEGHPFRRPRSEWGH